MQPHGQSDTGVDVGRDDTALRRAEPGRSGVRSLAARVLTVALLATLVALAALQAPPLQAQSLTTFVSNTDLTPAGITSDFFQAQSFETGAADGYTVSKVDIRFGTVSGRDTSVKIRENNGGEPGDLVATLTNPETLTADSLNTFTASPSITLDASTTYWISVNEGSSNRASLNLVDSDDQTGETGWGIGDGRLRRSSEISNWSTSSTYSLLIAIRGTVCDGIWCATLTVQDLGDGHRGCANATTDSKCSNAAHLTEDDFTHAMTDYSVTAARVESDGQLQLYLGRDIATDSGSLVLHVGSDTFAFEDADVKEGNHRKWDSSGLSWSTGEAVELKLTETREPAFTEGASTSRP